MSDRKPLGSKLFSFAVISDSHVNPSDDHCNSPFSVNRLANERYRYVAAMLNRLPIAFTLHLGDLLHPFPDADPQVNALYRQAAQRFRDMSAALNQPLFVMPGNHDIGDMPVLTEHTVPSTDAMRAAWQREFGDRAQCFDRDGVRFVLLDAQVLNSGSAAERDQWDWLDTCLAEAQAKGLRIFLCLHHPLFLCAPDDPEHYDIIDAPARGRLLGLIAAHSVEAVFTGHTHNYWFNRLGQTQFHLAPSTCFVRQDYSEMLRATPGAASDYGRNDTAKLGFFVVDVHEGGHVVRMQRSYGATGDDPRTALPLAPDPRAEGRPVLGFDLRQNWAEITEIPPCGAMFEFHRRVARNDYPLLALRDMGVRDLRVPVQDLTCPGRRARMRDLQQLGFTFTLFGLGWPDPAQAAMIAGHRDLIQAVEIAGTWPVLERLEGQLDSLGVPVFLDVIQKKGTVSDDGIYYHAINHGMDPQAGALMQHCAAMGAAGICFRLSASRAVEPGLRQMAGLADQLGLTASVQLRLATDSPAGVAEDGFTVTTRLVEAMIAARSLPGLRLFSDTLADVDRGFFVRQGVIDRLCNPRPAARAVQAMHHLLAGLDGTVEIGQIARSEDQLTMALTLDGTPCDLNCQRNPMVLRLRGPDGQDRAFYDLGEGATP